MTRHPPAPRRPKLVERLEEAVASGIEGFAARVFGTRLQPVQIAKRAIRAMESHRRVALERTFAPNSYFVSLSADDHAQFEPYQKSLERDLAESILGAARDRGYTLIAFPIVELAAAATLRRGEVRVSCALLDASGAELPDDALAIAARHTVVLDPEAAMPATAAPAGALRWGQASLGLGAAPVVLGRDRRCAVVLDDPRVSRRHAEIRPRLGRYTLTDLGSTNGTTVNGKLVTEVALADGDRIAIGPTELTFHI